MKEQNHPNVIKIRNAHVHNLKHIDVYTFMIWQIPHHTFG